MNQEIKAQWLEALRSGNYKQTKRVLRTKDNQFCCLGVLCDIVDPDAWVDSNAMNFLWRHGPGTGAGPSTFPSADLLDKAGVSNLDAQSLANMNDVGKSFKEIADQIEKAL